MHLLLEQRDRCVRLIVLLTVGAAFATLLFAAEAFGGDAGVLGLSDDVVRSVSHFCVYGSFAFLLTKALFNWHLLAWYLVAVAATVEEIHQLFVDWRFACVEDWLLNMAGITTFVLVSKFVLPRIGRAKREADGTTGQALA